MMFELTLPKFLQILLNKNPSLGTFFLRKLDLLYANMKVWVGKDIGPPSLKCAVPPHQDDIKPLIGLYPRVPMGYIESTPFFCVTKNSG